jgi:hypothetical protein
LLCVSVWLVAIAWLILTLSPASIWAAGICMLIAIAIWTAELLDIGWCSVRPPEGAVLVERFARTTILVWGVALLMPMLIVVSFGSIETDDDRMLPVVEPGERLIFHRRAGERDLNDGAIILYRLPPHAQGGTPGELVVARILARPDDELTIRGGHYVVNGEVSRYRANAANPKAPLIVPTYPRKLIVPSTRYFVVQDSPATGLDSQQLDYARQIDVVSTRLFHFGRRGLMRPVE